jgi:hypothetical protein
MIHLKSKKRGAAVMIMLQMRQRVRSSDVRKMKSQAMQWMAPNKIATAEATEVAAYASSGSQFVCNRDTLKGLSLRCKLFAIHRARSRGRNRATNELANSPLIKYCKSSVIRGCQSIVWHDTSETDLVQIELIEEMNVVSDGRGGIFNAE